MDTVASTPGLRSGATDNLQRVSGTGIPDFRSGRNIDHNHRFQHLPDSQFFSHDKCDVICRIYCRKCCNYCVAVWIPTTAFSCIYGSGNWWRGWHNHRYHAIGAGGNLARNDLNSPYRFFQSRAKRFQGAGVDRQGSFGRFGCVEFLASTRILAAYSTAQYPASGNGDGR